MSEMTAIIADLEYCFDQGESNEWSDLDWMNWAAATEPQKLKAILGERDKLEEHLHQAMTNLREARDFIEVICGHDGGIYVDHMVEPLDAFLRQYREA